MNSDRFIKFDDKGRLIAPNREMERWFAKREGQWRVVPAPQKLMIFERADEEESASSGTTKTTDTERVLFCGVITARGQLTDVINMLHSSRWEGSFHVMQTTQRKTLMLKSGDVVGAASTSRTDRLGELLSAHGVITREQLNETLKEAGGPQRLGAALISKKFLTPHQLYYFLNLQVKEIFFSLLLLEEGEYYFRQRKLDDPTWRQLRINTSSLLLDGMRRIDEMQYFRERIPSSKVIFEQGELQNPSLEDTDLSFLGLVDGRMDLVQIAQNAHLSEYDATRVAFRLLQAGIIRPRSENFLGQRGQRAHISGIPEILKLSNLVLSHLLQEATKVGRERELRQAPTAFFSTKTAYDQIFSGVELKADGSIDAAVLMKNITQCGAKKPEQFFYHGMNEFLSFCIFVVVDGLGVEKEQEIRTRIEKLLEGPR